MQNINELSTTYIVFNNLNELSQILSQYERFGFGYKNGTHSDAMRVAETTAVNKITCKDNFVLTSNEKITTMSAKVFLQMANSYTTNSNLINKNTTMNNTVNATLNELVANEKLSDKKYLSSIVEDIKSVNVISKNFDATLRKVTDKAGRLKELLSALDTAFVNRDMEEVERLQKLIKGSVKYVSKTNDILKSLNDTGEAIVAKETKDEDDSAATFIGE